MIENRAYSAGLFVLAIMFVVVMAIVAAWVGTA